MILTNEIFRKTILKFLDLEIGQVIKVKNLWHQIVSLGYREDLVRFLEVLEVRFTKQPYLDPGDLANALGATDGVDHNETKFQILECRVTQADPHSDDLADKAKYIVEFYGAHYIVERSVFADKPTMIFSIKLT